MCFAAFLCRMKPFFIRWFTSMFTSTRAHNEHTTVFAEYIKLCRLSTDIVVELSDRCAVAECAGVGIKLFVGLPAALFMRI